MTDQYGNASQPPQNPNMPPPPPPPPGGHQSVPQPGGYQPQGAPGYQPQPGPAQPQGYQPPAAGYGPGGPGSPGWTQGYEPQNDGNFFANLFDFTFKRYIAESVVKVLFILLLVAFGLGYLIAVILGFAASAGTGFLTLIVGGLFALLYLILIRVSLEAIVAAVQAAKNTEKLLQRS